jgi:hypothetical protein
MKSILTAALLLLTATFAFAEDPIAKLRAMGQPGVDALMRWRESKDLDPAAQRRFETAIDRVCRQRDCAWSGLYWYTDLAAAEQAAQREHKPILSLRLLGNLDEELSCANSRFFRTILYSNRDIAAYLRANFILHWKSERPVPKVTIDFGDGRTMVRTLTGNSIHYLLAPDGTVLDALPGMIAPKPFLAALQEMRRLYEVSTTWTNRTQSLAAYHAARRTDAPAARVAPPATAWNAGSLAMSKGGVETPILDTAWFGKRLRVPKIVKPKVTTIPLADLDGHSLQLIRSKRSPSTDDAFYATIRTLKQALDADTDRNEHELRPVIDEWLSHGSIDLESLNRRVYDELFLTPRSDRWLGLMPADVYNAIDGEGITTSSTAPTDTTSRRLSGAPPRSVRSRR